MCGRVVWVYDPQTGQLLKKLVDRPYEDDPELVRILEKQRYNVPPASHLPIVVGRPEAGNELTLARWGFPIPQRPNGVFNTRVESARDSPMWSGLLGTGHCVFVVKGFYEWRRDAKARKGVPHFIHRADGRPMALAGLAGTRIIDGESRLCASIVTCEANELVGEVHDRMPAVLEQDQLDAWLRPGPRSDRDVLAPIRPAGDGVLAMHAVDPAVNSTDNDRPELIEPTGQQRLF